MNFVRKANVANKEFNFALVLSQIKSEHYFKKYYASDMKIKFHGIMNKMKTLENYQILLSCRFGNQI